MNSDIIHTEEKWKKGDARILIIDKLLSRGWTSYFDMNVALFRELNGETKTIAKLDDKGLQEYCFEHQEYTNNIKVSDIPHMIDVWALIRRGVDIEGILEREKKNGRKVSENPIRDEMRQNFIEVHKIDPDNEEELTEHNLSDATLYYLKKGNTNGQSILVFRYKEQGYSIREDLLNYNKEQNTTRFSRNIDSGITYDMSDVGKYNLIPDPDVIARKRRALLIKALQDELIRDTTGAVRRRLEIINGLKKAKPQGWMFDTSNTYLNAIYDGQGILEGLELGPILHKYGSHLLDSKEYNQGQSFLQEGLDAFRETMLAGNDKAKEEYALILQNLAAIHITLGNYELSETEAFESLDIFRELERHDKSYQYGVAVLLNTLAGLHIKMRKFDMVEEEYEEATGIFSLISKEDPTKYLYMLVENITSLASYYQQVGRLDESIEAYEQAMPFLEKLSERNYDDFAPQKVTAMINFASALQDIGLLDEAEQLLLETIHILHRLNERSPNVYNEELSTVFNNLGVLMLSKEDVSQAKKFLSSAEQLRRALVGIDQYAFNSRLAATLDSQAQIDQVEGDIDAAIDKWKEALDLLEIYDCNEGYDLSAKIGECCFHLGYAFMAKEEVDEALLYLLKAEKIFRTLYDRDSPPKMFEDSFAMTMLLIGEIYETIEGKEDEAESVFAESLDVALWYASCTENQDLSFLVKLFFDYGYYFFNRGNYEKAKSLWEQGLTYGKEEIMKHPNTPYLQEILDVTIQGLDEIDAIL